MSALQDERPADGDSSLFAQRITEYVKAVNENRDQDAEAILWGTFEQVTAQAMANPSQDLIWRTLAGECEQLGNWTGAEDAHKKAITLAREHPNSAYPVKPLLDLASLYEILGRKEEARAHIDEALVLARESEMSSLVLMALEAKFHSDLDKRDLDDIRAAAFEGASATPDERVFALTKARFLLLQARCAVDSGEYESAEACMVAARELAGPHPRSNFLAGWQWYHSCAAEIAAKIHAARGETAQAIAAFSEAVAHRRTINAQSHVAGIRSRYRLAERLRALAGYLEAGGKDVEAAAARAEAEQIMREFSAT